MIIPGLRRSPSGTGYVSGGARAKVEDVDAKQGIVTVYFAAFGNVDSYGEIIRKGAFKKTVAEWGPKGRGRIAHLANHDPRHRIAVVQELKEDDHGLRAVSKILPAPHQAGIDALVEYEEGAIREHSIGFDVMKHEKLADPDGGPDRYVLTELRLYEGSAVTWGANMETPVLEVKSPGDALAALIEMTERMEAVGRCLTRGITDDHARDLEAQLALLGDARQNAAESLRRAMEPLGTPLAAQPITDQDALSLFLKSLKP